MDLSLQLTKTKKKKKALSSSAASYNLGHNLILLEIFKIYLTTMLQIRVFRMTGDIFFPSVARRMGDWMFVHYADNYHDND